MLWQNSAVSLTLLNLSETLKLKYLGGEFASVYENVLGCESVALREMFNEKKQSSKNSWDCPINGTQSGEN